MVRHLGVGIDADAVTSVRAESGASFGLVDAVAVAPTLVVVPGGGIVIGEEAEHLADAGAGAVFRDFSGRVGDPVPVVGSDGSARPGAELTALTVEQLLTRATGAGAPASIVVAHPAGWGDHERSRMRAALVAAGTGALPTVMVSRPVAAVATALADGRITVGDAVVVADIGNRATEITVVADVGGAARVLGHEQTDELGSHVLDHAVLTHVRTESANIGTPHGRAALRRLAAACRVARRELAQHPAAVVEIGGPYRPENVRMVRTEFESAVSEPIRSGVAAIAASLRHAQADGIDVRAVLLVGEAAATPLLIEMTSAFLRLPVIVPQYPEWAVSGGAARIATRIAARPDVRRPPMAPRPAGTTPVPPPARHASASRNQSPTPPPPAPARSRTRTGLIAAVIAGALVIGGGMTVAEMGAHGGGAGFSSQGR